jgi:hypothetical protein
MGVNYDNAMSGLSKKWSSRQKSGNGWLYQIASYRNADNDFFTLKILIEDGTSTAIISRSPKTTLYEFDLAGATRGTSIPYDLRVRISSDFEAVGAEYKAEQDADTRTEQEKWIDAQLEAEKQSGGSGTIFRPYVFEILQETDFPALNIMASMNDVKYTLERGVGARSEQGVMVEMVIYRVGLYMDGELRPKPYTTEYDNQADAETAYQEAVDAMIAQRVRLEEIDALPDIETTILDYRGYEVTYYNDDGYSTTSDEANFYRLKKDGDLVMTVYPPQVSAGRDNSGEYPVNINVTVPDYNYDNPQPAIDAWELVINGRIDGRVTAQTYAVKTWEYYIDNIGAKDNPFDYLEVYGQIVQQDNGMTMLLNDVDVDIFGTRASSGSVRMRVKNGYEATMRIATENFAYWIKNIDGLETTGEGMTGSFVNPHPQIQGISVGGGGAGLLSNRLEVVQITLKGGDIIHIDIDDKWSNIADLKIQIDGKDYASDAANINDETYLVMESVSYSDDNLFDDYDENKPQDVQPDEPEDNEDDDGTEDGDGILSKIDGKTILIVGGVIIGLAVVASLISGSGE